MFGSLFSSLRITSFSFFFLRLVKSPWEFGRCRRGRQTLLILKSRKKVQTSAESKQQVSHTNKSLSAGFINEPAKGSEETDTERKDTGCAELGWIWPLRNWNSFRPLIELHALPVSVCLSVWLTGFLFQLHIKKAICSKEGSQHTTHSHLLNKFPLPNVQMQLCLLSHQFSSLI